MSKSVSLPGNQELQFVTDSWDKTITVYLFDTISDTRVTLTEFSNGKWNSKSVSHLDKFIELVKINPKIKITMKKAFSELKEETTNDFMTSMKCLRRRIIVKIKKHLK